jgi:uncharacterized protein YjbJ (UPF0337 family)
VSKTPKYPIKIQEGNMNKDQVEGKVKDIAGRAERQVGEWTGNTEAQLKGTAKQAEGKVQNAYGNVKDAGEKAADQARANEAAKQDIETDQEKEARARKAS